MGQVSSENLELLNEVASNGKDLDLVQFILKNGKTTKVSSMQVRIRMSG